MVIDERPRRLMLMMMVVVAAAAVVPVSFNQGGHRLPPQAAWQQQSMVSNRSQVAAVRVCGHRGMSWGVYSVAGGWRGGGRTTASSPFARISSRRLHSRISTMRRALLSIQTRASIDRAACMRLVG